MKKIFSIAVLLSLLLITSCQREVLICSTDPLSVGFTGFAASDLAGATIYTYKKDALFDSVIDSSQMTLTTAGYPDTLVYRRPYSHEYDYKVVLPEIGKTYLITAVTPGKNITQTITHSIGDAVKYGCVNHLVSYTLNGSTYSVGPKDTYGYVFIYISR